MAGLGRESETIEFKESTTELEDALIAMVAMLNKRCYGIVYFGVKNNGTVVGHDVGVRTITTISQAFKNHVDPSVIPKIDILSDGEKEYLKVEAEGNNRPYAFRGTIYLRSGEENKKMPMAELRKLFQSTSDLLRISTALNQDLTFHALCEKLSSRGLHVTDGPKFYRSHSLVNMSGKFNIQAELLSDQNVLPLTVVVFSSNDRSDISIRKQFDGPLFESMRGVYDYIESLNEAAVDMGGPIRTERKLIDLKAFDEAWTNACVHNTWVLGIPPTVHVFNDRLEIISYGGTPYFQTEEEFFDGETMPVNESLMQIFLAIGLTEHTGHGVPVIVGVYGRDSYNLDRSTVKVTMRFPFERGGGRVIVKNPPVFSELESKVLEAIVEDPHVTLNILSEKCGTSRSNAGKIVRLLREKGVLERVGSKKAGVWRVVDTDESRRPKF